MLKIPTIYTFLINYQFKIKSTQSIVVQELHGDLTLPILAHIAHHFIFESEFLSADFFIKSLNNLVSFGIGGRRPKIG